MQKPIIPVVCAVIVSEGLVLAVQRGAEQLNAGLWEFPGGKIEGHESDQEALIREIEEELMVNIRLVMRLNTVSWEYENQTIELRPYFAEIIYGEIHLQEHASMKWLKAADLGILDWAPADIAVVQEVKEALKDA